jgi:hypothetical protein
VLKELMTEMWFPLFRSKSRLSKITIPGWKLLYLSGDLALMRQSGSDKQKWVRYKEFGYLMISKAQYGTWAKQNNFSLEDQGDKLTLTPL